MTKKMLAVPLILLAVGCRDRYEGQAGAASSPSPSPYAETGYASPGTMSGAAGDAGSVSAVVVAVDEAGRTITVREAGSAATTEGRRLNVSPAAASSLSGVRAGDTVMIGCDATAGATGTGTTGTTGGTGTTGMGAGAGSLANCTMVTTITPGAGAAGR
jgi:hypothetical protein